MNKRSTADEGRGAPQLVPGDWKGALEAMEPEDAKRPRRQVQDPAMQEALDAIAAAEETWNRVDDSLSWPISHLLTAVRQAAEDRDLDALNATNGPVEWARNRLGYHHRRAKSAADFVACIARVLPTLEGPKGTTGAHALTDRELAMGLANSAAVWLATFGGPSGLVTEPAVSGSPARTVSKIQAVARRDRPDAKAFAVAILEGWGLSRDEARNRLKYSDI